MKILALTLALLSTSAFAESANIRVSPFKARVELRKENVKIESAELILSTNFCFIASSCQSGSDRSKVVVLEIDQKNEILNLALKKTAVMKDWRPLPYKIQSCSLLIILRGKNLIGRLDVGSLGSTTEECSDEARANNFLRDFLLRSPEVRWI